MKKLLAILIAAFMLFSMVACDTGDDPNPSGDNPPGTTQNGGENQGGENNKQSKEWPTDKVAVWSGSGKIVEVKDNSGSSNDYTNYYIVDVDTATLDEFTAYIATLKSAGYSYSSADEEPSAGYRESDTSYTWNGTTTDGSRVQITLYKSEQQGLTGSMSVYNYILRIATWIK